MPIKPVYRIRIQAIVTGDDISSGNTPPTFTSSFKPDSIKFLVSEVNKLYAAAGVQFDFDPSTDIKEINRTDLNARNNHEVDNNCNEFQKIAKKYPGKLVIYFTIGGSKSGEDIDFAALPKRETVENARRMAHELGHYFHLSHTFDDDKIPKIPEVDKPTISNQDAVAELQKQQVKFISDYIAEGNDPKDGLNVFNGDLPAVQDTPPDDRGQIFYYLNNRNSAGPIDSVEINVPGYAQPYVLKPDRTNIMSYFYGFDEFEHRFSSHQINIIRDTMENRNRKHLIEMPQTFVSEWVHGTKVEAEYPDRLTDIERKGWGTVFHGKNGTANWFHIPITTPVIEEGVHPRLSKIFVLYKAASGSVQVPTAQITNIHIYDGTHVVKKFDDLNFKGDHSTVIDSSNSWGMKPTIKIQSGLGITVGVSFPHNPWADSTPITFTTAGADFARP